MFKLIALLVSAIPAIVSGILAFVARKVATASGSIAAFAALTVAFIAANQTIFSTLNSYLNPPQSVVNAVGMFIPGDFGVCLSAWCSAKICRAAYDMARDKLGFINSAN